MKNVLRTKIAKAAISMSLLTQSLSIAQANELDFSKTKAPVAFGTSCEMAVTTPKGSLGWFPSGDCSTVYYLPQADGIVEIPAFSATAETMLCSGLDKYRANRADLQQEIDDLMKQAGRAKSASDRDFINSKVTLLQGYLADGKDIYSNKEGAYAQLVFKKADAQQIDDNWYTANKQLVYQHIAFQAAPITTSVLTFTSRKTDGMGSSILYSSSVPGLELQQNGSYKATVFNGSLSGQVVFSVIGACGLIGLKPKTLADVKAAKVDPAAVSSYLVANHSFDVPTRTQLGYIATLDQEKALNFMQAYAQERPDGFKVSEFVSSRSQADLDGMVSLNLTTGVLSAEQKVDWDKMKATVQTEVATNLVASLTAAVASLDKLSTPPITAEAAPKSGVENVAHPYQSCSSSSSWFGLSSSSSCHEEVTYVAVQRSGHSDLNQYAKTDFHIALTQSLLINDVYNYSFTTTFSYKKPTPAAQD